MDSYQEIPHTDACLKHQEWIKEQEIRMVHWRAEWPRYCHTCDGRGIVLYDAGDPSVGLGPEYDYCDICVLAGTCPRCGDQHYAEILEGSSISSALFCAACGYVFDGEQECVASLMNDIAYMDACICIDERYARWRELNPLTRHEEALEMGMTDTEAAEYSKTGDIPDSYLRRADFEHDARRERRNMGRFYH